jgi:hypothetical protein
MRSQSLAARESRIPNGSPFAGSREQVHDAKKKMTPLNAVLADVGRRSADIVQKLFQKQVAAGDGVCFETVIDLSA